MTETNSLPAYAIDMGAPCDSKGRINFGWTCNYQGQEQLDNLGVEHFIARLRIVFSAP